MTESIANQYIDEIAERYKIADKDRAKLEANHDQIDRELGQYTWSDVRGAIAEYYRTKSDKHRPTLAQIVALLETNPDVHKIGTAPETEPYRLPRTKLWAIKNTFDAVIKAMVQCEILAPENPMDTPLKPGFSLLDDHNLPLVKPLAHLRSAVCRAKDRRPDLFAPFKNTTFWEDLAIAVQNQLITLRIRDWHEFYQGLPNDIKSVIRNRGTDSVGETSATVNRMIAAWSGAGTVGVRVV